MSEPTVAKKIGTDLAGSSMTTSLNDFRRDKAVRKILYFNPFNKRYLIDFITDKQTTAERYDTNGAIDANGELVHPEKPDLPLQTVNVVKVGRDRWMATLNYFRIPSGGWGGSDTSDLLQMRTSMQPMRVYTDGTKTKRNEEGEPVEGTPTYDAFYQYSIPGGELLMSVEESKKQETTPNSYSAVIQIPEVTLMVPFARTSNPFTNGQFLGGVNTQSITFGSNLTFRTGQVRFDGVQMTDQGSAVTAGGVTGRYVGSYQFTATPTYFYHQVPKWDNLDKVWRVELQTRNVNINGGWSSFSALGL
tara:strand:+ start:182 stop:1093 length:912 start_codon:yes stop_codon:yes gene_type:complete